MVPRRREAAECGGSDADPRFLPRTRWTEDRKLRTALVDVMLKSIRGHGWRAKNHIDIRRDYIRHGAEIVGPRFDDQAGLPFFQLGCAIFSGDKVKILRRGVSSPEGETCDGPGHLIDCHAASTL